MKKIISLILLQLIFIEVSAQTYKIVISYDANGNRIKRERVCVSCPLPYSEEILAMWSIYPNPSSGLFTIQISEALLDDKTSVTVTDVSGRQILSKSIITTQTKIDLSQVADGSYLFTIRNREKTLSEQVVKLGRQ